MIKPWYKTWWGLLAIILVFLLLISIFTDEPKNPKKNKQNQQLLTKKESRKPKAKKAKKQRESKYRIQSPTEQLEATAIVINVVDGDTIDVQFADGHTDRVRYIGIDTWESWDQPHGSHGTEANRSLVLGKEVRLVKDVSERDKYGRLLRYVYVGNIFVNAKLVADGHAKASNYPPDSAYASEFAELQKQATGKGCFATVAAPAPSYSPSFQEQSGSYIGNRNSRKLHNLAHKACQNYVSMMSEGNKISFSSEAAANAQGYYACLKC